MLRPIALCLPWIMLLGAARVHAQPCAASAACEAGAYPDRIELSTGESLCGLVVHREEGRSVIVVTATETRTLAWHEIRCIAAGSERSRVAVAPTPSETPAVQQEPSWGGLGLDWELRLAGTGLWKRYRDEGRSAGSWGIAGGIGAGVSLRYQSRAAPGARGLCFYTAELGLGTSVSLGSWRQLGGHSASFIEQDISLLLGGRIALGTTRAAAGALEWSGVMLGLGWLPSYVDFYGSRIEGHGTIHPAGMRLTVDIGKIAGPVVGQDALLRLALSFLPYIGRLPTALSLSAGVLFY